jgi:transitional endoplasmic reticulum ATPase
MSFAIEIKTPSLRASTKIVTRVLLHQKLKVDADTTKDLVHAGTPPAVMVLAARAGALSGGGGAHMKIAARSVTRMLALDTKTQSSDLAGIGFDPAFARWIAGRMGMKVLQKRGSDLLSKWVGESEKNIARTFEEAADRDAFLIFGEVDSLLDDRTRAHKSWEVSQVNDMLTWMKRHPLPFAAPTNIMQGLDPAALRRFLFKAQFKPLLPHQARTLFLRTFGVAAPLALD